MTDRHVRAPAKRISFGEPLPARDRLGEIRAAAVELFHRKGYHATSMREIAELVGVRTASLYHHLPSKQELLRAVLVAAMEDLSARLVEAVEAVGDCPEEQLRAAIRAEVTYHGTQRLEAAISDSELRGLTQENFCEVVELRDCYERTFADIIRRGRELGLWHADEKLARLLIVSMGTTVARWYRDEGPVPLEKIADFFADFVLFSLKSPGWEARRQKAAVPQQRANR